MFLQYFGKVLQQMDLNWLFQSSNHILCFILFSTIVLSSQFQFIHLNQVIFYFLIGNIYDSRVSDTTSGRGKC